MLYVRSHNNFDRIKYILYNIWKNSKLRCAYTSCQQQADNTNENKWCWWRFFHVCFLHSRFVSLFCVCVRAMASIKFIHIHASVCVCVSEVQTQIAWNHQNSGQQREIHKNGFCWLSSTLPQLYSLSLFLYLSVIHTQLVRFFIPFNRLVRNASVSVSLWMA